MTSIGSPSPFFLAGKKKVYVVDRSLRFDDDQSSPTRLTRTVQSGGNLKKFTVSFWVKRSQLGNTSYSNSAGNSGQDLLHSVGGGNRGVIKFTSADKIQFTQGKDAGGAGNISTTSVFRDVSAWYHICVVADYANSTTADRGKIFVNGVRQEVSTHTNFDNADGKLNTNQIHEIGFNEYGSGYTGSSWWSNFFCGYMAEFYFIDGQAYDPSYFTETNATTGQLVPKEYTGSFGTTGWYLNFSDNTGTTATTLGKDSSSNSNNWTPNGFSTSAGEGNDSVLDTPTTNYCTLNTLDKAAAITFKNGNLQVDNSTTGNYDGFRGTFGSKTGKYYWEIKFPSTGYMDAIGIARADGRIDTNNQPTYRIVLGLGSWYNSYNSGGVATYVNATPSGDYPNVATWSGASNYSSNDIYMIAVDFGAGKIWWGKNNSWFNNSGTANPATGTDPRITFTTGNEWFPYSQSGDSSTSPQAYNFGQQGFAYTPPSGFVALNSANLPDPAILLPDKHFDTKLYTGNGSTGQTITYNFGPDFVWMKNRSGSNNHAAVNTVIGRAKGLYPDVGSGEFNSSAGRDVSAFTSNGFTVGEPEQASSTNNNGSSIVAWAWNAGDTDGKTYTVKVVSDSGNKYRFDNFGTSAVTLDLAEGGTYIFNMDDASNASHPFSIGTAANGTVYTLSLIHI